MNVEKLSRLLESPETHRQILRGYSGPYSLGIGQDLQRSQGPVVVLQVASLPAEAIPAEIQLNGETVAVVVRTGFVQPRPLGTVRAAATVK